MAKLYVKVPMTKKKTARFWPRPEPERKSESNMVPVLMRPGWAACNLFEESSTPGANKIIPAISGSYFYFSKM